MSVYKNYYCERYRIISLKILMDMHDKIIYESFEDFKNDKILQKKLTKIIKFESKFKSNYYDNLLLNLTMNNYEENVFGVQIFDPFDFYIHCLIVIQRITNKFNYSSDYDIYKQIREKIINEITSEHNLELLIENNYKQKINEKYKNIISIENTNFVSKNSTNNKISKCVIYFGVSCIILALLFLTFIIIKVNTFPMHYKK